MSEIVEFWKFTLKWDKVVKIKQNRANIFKVCKNWRKNGKIAWILQIYIKIK